MRWLQRSVGLAIIAAAALGAVALWVAVASGDPRAGRSPSEGVLFGIWSVFYDTEMPAPRVMLAAVGVALLLAAGVAGLERRLLTRARRSEDGNRMPLAPKLVMAQTHGEYAGPVTITVLIPAHNEEGCISETLASLLSQSLPPARIVVVADNCTDATVRLAREAGVDVFETVRNTHKTAGGLNQALHEVLPGQGDNDCVMIMDADTTLDAGFLEGAARRLTDDRALMAVGGLFYGEDIFGLIGQFQRNEYTRYQRDLRRRRGRVFVLTGTASVFRPRACAQWPRSGASSCRASRETSTTRSP